MIRYTAKRNEQTQQVEVLKVTDGPDGTPISTEVDSAHGTTAEANGRIKELVA